MLKKVMIKEVMMDMIEEMMKIKMLMLQRMIWLIGALAIWFLIVMLCLNFRKLHVLYVIFDFLRLANLLLAGVNIGYQFQ